MVNVKDSGKFKLNTFIDTFLRGAADSYGDREITVSRAELDVLVASLGYLRASIETASEDIADAFRGESDSAPLNAERQVSAASMTGLAEGHLRGISAQANNAFNNALALAGYPSMDEGGKESQ